MTAIAEDNDKIRGLPLPTKAWLAITVTIEATDTTRGKRIKAFAPPFSHLIKRAV
ncbi:hypothetical protein AE1304_00360 [Aeromonas enteropelogenes]